MTAPSISAAAAKGCPLSSLDSAYIANVVDIANINNVAARRLHNPCHQHHLHRHHRQHRQLRCTPPTLPESLTSLHAVDIACIVFIAFNHNVTARRLKRHRRLLRHHPDTLSSTQCRRSMRLRLLAAVL